MIKQDRTCLDGLQGEPNNGASARVFMACDDDILNDLKCLGH